LTEKEEEYALGQNKGAGGPALEFEGVEILDNAS
jgi:hypothetical protein